MNKIVVVMSDIFFSAKINDAAKKFGTGIVVVQDEGRALDRINELPPLVVMDLNCSTVDPIGLIRKIKANPVTQGIPIVGFVSHVQIEVRQKAAEAGCDLVGARSVFAQDVQKILERFIPVPLPPAVD